MTTKKSIKSKYKGVSWSSDHGRWACYLWVDGKRKYIGIFSKEKEAAVAYDRNALTLVGRTAKINFSIANYSDLIEELQTEGNWIE